MILNSDFQFQVQGIQYPWSIRRVPYNKCRNCLYFELGACSGYTFTLMLATQLKDNQGNVGWRCLYYTETNIKNNVVETIPKNKISTCNFNNSISFSCILNLTIWLPSEKIQQIIGFTWSKFLYISTKIHIAILLFRLSLILDRCVYI